MNVIITTESWCRRHAMKRPASWSQRSVGALDASVVSVHLRADQASKHGVSILRWVEVLASISAQLSAARAVRPCQGDAHDVWRLSKTFAEL